MARFLRSGLPAVLLTSCVGLALPYPSLHLERDALTLVPRPVARPSRIRIVGDADLVALTRGALDRLFATRVGTSLRERLESDALPGPLVIELNLRGDDFTPYEVPGGELAETIVFDAWSLPEVETELGRVRATRESVLAHELGHAVLKLRSEEQVIREVENPIRVELGLPRRVRF